MLTTVKVFHPFNALGDESGCMTTEMVLEGYSYSASSAGYYDADNSDNDPADCTIGNFKGMLMAGHNLWFDSHGSTALQCVEVYNTSAAAYDRYDTLLGVGYSTTHIDVAEAGGKYCIAVKPAGVAA
jgi:hypothetical protein